ncbi:hypothetical protein CO695_12955 [Providencia alcalifaciens]|uniref:Phage protein n=1 Tax=Providencia alcalifaciens DSM 30120 TaxID=520999 RepID=B6XKR8_9GAMM|nr:hypothetical protein [Providencia alcalifaciens]ATG17158.1 hypothetical protein CO695_12955 [Providencia alcalifaciens]EEB44101.1 hypothetical protein PROVALCAL_03978 [Providencia alcalifaciens DSM 30120]SQI38056.1 Uncharacterised protein [Providencia alcalifaciens]
MLFMNIEHKYYSQAGGEDKGGGAGGAPEITPEIQSIIDKAVNDQVSGLKAKRDELLGKLKEQGDNLKRYEGIDPDKVRDILKRFDNDEEAKLIAEGKIDEVLNKRTERLRGDTQKQVSEANSRVERAEAFANKFRDRVLSDEIRSAAGKAEALASAHDDLILRAKGVFKIDDEGKAVAVDSNGSPVMGKDGKTPLTAIEWIESLKESAPHLFPSASGTGAGNSKSGSVHFKRSQMSSSEKADYIRRYGRDSYLKLPKE